MRLSIATLGPLSPPDGNFSSWGRTPLYSVRVCIGDHLVESQVEEWGEWTQVNWNWRRLRCMIENPTLCKEEGPIQVLICLHMGVEFGARGINHQVEVCPLKGQVWKGTKTVKCHGREEVSLTERSFDNNFGLPRWRWLKQLHLEQYVA
jgi:hypothetical protein